MNNKPIQRNNIKIRKRFKNTPFEKWACFSPNGKCLEEFDLKENAIKWAEETSDFLQQ